MSSQAPRVIAVDWSGDKSAPQKKIWLAEVREGRMVRLESGRGRREVIDHVLEDGRRDPNLVVGLDFAFSFPRWFCEDVGAETGPDLWRHVAERGEDWLADCPEPFWGRPGKKRPDLAAHFRVTEEEASALLGSQPKSVFQIGGGGAVGTGSIRGMPFLLDLVEGGFSVFPFTPMAFPLVLEIYPRTLTGPVVKSDQASRERYLAEGYPEMTAEQVEVAASGEDAFDAAVSAVIMARHLDQIRALEDRDDPTRRLEGEIWSPDPGRAGAVPPADSHVIVGRSPSPEAARAKRVSTKASGACSFCDRWVVDRAVMKSDFGLALPDRYPVSRGHTLVIPREHTSSLYALAEDAQADLWALVARVRERLEADLEPDGFTIGINDGAAAGQTISHAHIHVIPRWEGDVPDPRGGVRWVVPEKAPYWGD